MLEDLHRAIRLIYTGNSQRARRFRYGLIAFDALSIIYFIGVAPFPVTPTIMTINIVLGLLIFLDFSARLWISENRKRELRQIYVLADIVVIASIVLSPFLAESLAFLRVLRALRLIRAFHLLRDLRRESVFFRRHEDAIIAAVNLFVFIFVTTSLVFVYAFDDEPGFEGYVDAVYFTIATLTTTGFGDITMTTPGGKLLSVVIMVVGVGLFLQLLRALFQPAKIKYKCPECGLNRHDADAIHCKHCGEALKIETDGAGYP